MLETVGEGRCFPTRRGVLLRPTPRDSHLTPDEVRRLLFAGREYAPELVPYLAIAVFAGVRPTEVQRLTTDDGKQREDARPPLPEAAAPQRHDGVLEHLPATTRSIADSRNGSPPHAEQQAVGEKPSASGPTPSGALRAQRLVGGTSFLKRSGNKPTCPIAARFVRGEVLLTTIMPNPDLGGKFGRLRDQPLHSEARLR